MSAPNLHYFKGRWCLFRSYPLAILRTFRNAAEAAEYLDQPNAMQPHEGGESTMSAKTIFEQIFGFALLAGEQLAPIVVHNPRSQQFVTVLTPDVNALFQLLESQGAMAPTAPATPAPPAA